MLIFMIQGKKKKSEEVRWSFISDLYKKDIEQILWNPAQSSTEKTYIAHAHFYLPHSLS